jgi:hypothetical protein
MSMNPFEGMPDSSNDPIESEISPNTHPDPKEVFRVLVHLQDRGETVEISRARVVAQFGITPAELTDIEREGISGNWPPLE